MTAQLSNGEEQLLRAAMVLARAQAGLRALLEAPGGDAAGVVAIAQALDLVKLGSVVVITAEVER